MYRGWYAGAGLVPLICLDPLHDQSPAHALPGQMLGCLLFSSLGAHIALGCIWNIVARSTLKSAYPWPLIVVYIRSHIAAIPVVRAM